LIKATIEIASLVTRLVVETSSDFRTHYRIGREGRKAIVQISNRKFSRNPSNLRDGNTSTSIKRELWRLLILRTYLYMDPKM
jgi:hypothetical protein